MFASAGNTLHIHSLERGGLKTISKFSPKPNVNIKQISWCHDNSYIAILLDNEKPQILSTKDPGEITLVHTITLVAEVTALKFKTNTKRLIALGTRRGEVMLYDTKNRCVIKVLGQLPSQITALEFSSPNELAVISGNNLVIFNLTDSDKTEYSTTEMCTTLKCLNKNSGQIVVGCENGMIAIWDTGVGKKEVKTYHLHTAGITGIALSNKDRLMVTTGMDNKICVIDNTTQKCIFKKILHQPITSIDISASEEHMIAGLKDGSIYVYQMSDHLKPQICSRMHPCSINQISFVNGLTLELLESDSIVDEENECEVRSVDTKEKDFSIDTISGPTSSEEIADFKKDQQASPALAVENVEIPEEKVKSDLIRIINGHFKHLEEQLADHCGKLQELVSSELDSLYAVAARWECFKTMELEEIVRYICGVVNAPSETRILSQKSEHNNMKLE